MRTFRKYDGIETNYDLPSPSELILPSKLKPLHYDLLIKTYLPSYVSLANDKKLTFDGKVVITIKAVEPAQEITLNMKNITLISTKCDVVTNDDDVIIKEVVELHKVEKVIFVLSRILRTNEEVKLKISYVGPIGDKLGGFYQSTYNGPDGKTKIAAITQFEPTDARLMVPCFDEPQYKANWTVTVIHPTGTKAISNCIEISEEKDASGNWITTKFKTTPRMSSYLLAIFVSEFDYIEQYTKDGIRVRSYFRVWSRPEAKMMTQYALAAGIRCLQFYEEYYKIKYPLEKQGSGGRYLKALAYFYFRENLLLYDVNLYDPLEKQRVAVVVAHELAHQWFGNLVTMQWWDDLWLNEGFATMVEYIGADEISSGQMRMKDFFLLDSLSKAFNADSLASSHPVSLKIERSSEINEVFDSISYDKGASLLVMLSALIGEDKFQKGVTHYLKKFSYNNAQAYNLWNTFDEVINDTQGLDGGSMNITEFANQWTTQACALRLNNLIGYPILTVECYNFTTFKITQQRYKKNKKAKEVERYRHPSYGFKWDVPVWYQIADEDVELVFSARTRNAIISDVFAAAKVDMVQYETAFQLLSYLTKEKDYLPWAQVIDSLMEIVDIFGNEPESKLIKNYTMGLLKKMYVQIDFDEIAKNYRNDSLFFEISRDVKIIKTYCYLGSLECKKKFRTLFNENVMMKCQKNDLVSHCVSIAAPLRSNTYCYGVQDGDDKTYQKVMDLYKAERVQKEKNRLLNALGCHNDVTTLKTLLQLALDRNSSVFRLQDVAAVFETVSKNPIGREFMFSFLIEKWESIYKSLSTYHSTMGDVIASCTKGIRTMQQIEQLKSLRRNGLRAVEFGEFDRQIEKAEEKYEWMKKHSRKLMEILEYKIASY
ncbi:peptidase family M1 [Dictyocaulus viviparus]|uniref:Aminopeptidase n=1 Tax=Dictyocaulus viviparus TaxID=29172 RepID=A0A0D8Y2E4_DICVI|nr:peptidase family M1 [Dictyocaulus viviparus]